LGFIFGATSFSVNTFIASGLMEEGVAANWVAAACGLGIVSMKIALTFSHWVMENVNSESRKAYEALQASYDTLLDQYDEKSREFLETKKKRMAQKDKSPKDINSKMSRLQKKHS